MVALPQPDKMTEEEYLAFERQSEFRHEYIDGEIYAMTGAKRAHNLITSNINTALNTQLREHPCEIYVSDMRVQVSEAGSYVYPDVVVACGEPEFRPDSYMDTLLNPTVIVEVLSDSTELFDRGVKWANYRLLPSLQAYLLVSQYAVRIERYTRHQNDGWLYTDVTDMNAAIAIESIGCELVLSDVYAKVSFEDNSPTSE